MDLLNIASRSGMWKEQGSVLHRATDILSVFYFELLQVLRP